MPKVLEKVERRLGEKLLLKGSRCDGPKCAAVRRAYPPGFHGKKKQRRASSEFGQLMREKQKVRFLYGLDDKDIKRYNQTASLKGGVFTNNFVKLLESRLDNVVFRGGFVESRRIARQAVGHGHIMVNGRVVKIPSYQVHTGDQITIKEQSLSSQHFADIETRLKQYEPARWLKLEKSKKLLQVIAIPELDHAALPFEVTKIKEFYSR